MNKIRQFAALISITIILLAFGNVAKAQVEDDDPQGLYIEKPRLFYAGLVAGANFSQVDGDYYAGYHKAGLNVGGIGYARLYKHLALSWEILYSQKGATSTFARVAPADTVVVIKYAINNAYAEIPLMVNYFDKRKSHFGMGVSFNRMVSSIEDLQTKPAVSLDLNKYPFKKTAFDLLAGVELHLVQGLFLNIRFQYSLVPIRTASPPHFSRAQNQFNNMWTVRLMYLFI